VKVIEQVIGRIVEFGGETASGWLPSNAATPLPTPPRQLIFDVRILEGRAEFILEWQSADGDYSNDSWHATIEEAKTEASERFGIAASEWREIG
jgi:hypothetical protein